MDVVYFFPFSLSFSGGWKRLRTTLRTTLRFPGNGGGKGEQVKGREGTGRSGIGTARKRFKLERRRREAGGSNGPNGIETK
jgi:hypothetical protein